MTAFQVAMQLMQTLVLGLDLIAVVQWNPYNVDTLWNKRSVLIIGVSAFQRYGLYAHTLKQSSSMQEKYQYKTNL